MREEESEDVDYILLYVRLQCDFLRWHSLYSAQNGEKIYVQLKEQEEKEEMKGLEPDFAGVNIGGVEREI